MSFKTYGLVVLVAMSISSLALSEESKTITSAERKNCVVVNYNTCMGICHRIERNETAHIERCVSVCAKKRELCLAGEPNVWSKFITP